VHIGKIAIGGDNPIRIQSMTNTSTMDTQASISQCMSIINAGGELVRLTAQGVKEAQNLQNIRAELRKINYETPIIADIHFNINAAITAAKAVDKVRINPGNFVDAHLNIGKPDFSEIEYQQGINKIRSKLIPFLNVCKEHNTAVRIGVNHGSLSDRIMSKYGDTVDGMVESCMEYLRICIEEDFREVVVSMKASSVRVMVESVRLLVRKMDEEGMEFPIHLGVTEASDGEDGRIKSAVGIGVLLYEGIGDTIRVSLSEAPENEIPVAKALINYIHGNNTKDAQQINLPQNAETRKVPIVIADYSNAKHYQGNTEIPPDIIYRGSNYLLNIPQEIKELDMFEIIYPQDINPDTFNRLKQFPKIKVILSAENFHEQKIAFLQLKNKQIPNQIIIHRKYSEPDADTFRLKAAADCGYFFLQGLADGIFLQNTAGNISPETVYLCSFGILQAAEARITKTEYIACPGCGRTLFDLQNTLKQVKEATKHLKGLKIGVMGCIVNGPGEMAGADYGYVGAGSGKISLYKGKECIKKNIPEADAIKELLKVIQK
jgi:(E)-4-hydroxy-3-methylbut-2-enyl-diphosphate synthase